MPAVSAIPSCAWSAPVTVGSRPKAIAGAANTQGAIGATTERKRGPRKPGRENRGMPRLNSATVSGAARSAASTTTIRAMCGRYGTAVGAGAHCASNPATSGPSANPAVIPAAARLAT